MKTSAHSKPALRLVPMPTTKIDPDLVAFTVMEHIDKNFAAMWNAAPVGARGSIRNAIVRAVVAEAVRMETPA
jgi:hypothetical protein